MSDILLVPIAVVYLLVVAALFAYGLNFFHLAWGAHHERNALKQSASAQLSGLPPVTVQLPIFNERYVARRLIEAAAALDYPSHLLEIQALDDSTDDTFSIVKEAVECLRGAGIDIKHLHRTERRGFKARVQGGRACRRDEDGAGRISPHPGCRFRPPARFPQAYPFPL